MNFFLASVLGSVCAVTVGNAQASSGDCLVYVGTYTGAKSKGIYVYRMNLATGELNSLGLAAETPSPSFLAFDPKHRFLYAANETGNFEGKHAGAVTAFSIDSATGQLTQLNQRSSLGADPCHLLVDREGRTILVANYTGGNVAVLPVQPDGRLGDSASFIQHTGKGTHPTRQEGPHAHCVALDAENNYAFVCDLGLDKVMIYHFDAKKGALDPNGLAFAQLHPGAGPRHIAFSPNDHYAYVINELDSTITVFAYDHRHGRLKELQTIATLPDDHKGDHNSTAEIEVHPSGKFLYASNRGHDSIAVFAVHKDGTLHLVEHQNTQGKTPRNFGIDPSGKYMLVANQNSDNIAVFDINPTTGKLKFTGQTVEVGSPVCVKFLPVTASAKR